MKKIINTLACVFMFLLVLTGCSFGQKKVVSLTVKEGTLNYAYEQNQEYSFDDIKVVATYNDKTKEEVGRDALTIGEFSTANLGDYKVKIGYGGMEIEVTLSVITNLNEYYEVNGFEPPASITTFNDRSGVNDDANTVLTEADFSQRKKTYKVGDDNPFKLFSNITVVDDKGVLIPVNAYTSVSQVYEKVENNYTLLEGAALDAVVVVNEENSTYDFTDAAVGRVFKIVARPANLTQAQISNIEKFSVTLECEIVDGYNVTKAVELGILNNDVTEDKYAPWTSLLTNNNITRPTVLNGIVLHNDLTITKTDIPAAYYTGDTYSGQYLKNDFDGDTDLYRHVVEDGKTFNFYGNYFTMNFSAIPTIDTTISGEKYSTAAVFKFAANENTAPTKYTTTFSNFTDVSMIGNGTLTYQDEGRGFGTLIGFKATAHTVTLDNCIIKSFFINTYAEYNNTIFNIKNVKAYDAYQNNLFTYGGKEVNISNSEFKRSGGPAMLLQHVNPTDNPNDHYSIANVTNSIIESFVTGNEPWFDAFGATKDVAQISLLASMISPDYLDANGEINMIGLNMSDGAGITGASGVQGKIVIDGKVPSNMLYNDTQNAQAVKIKQAIDEYGGQIPVFMSSEGVIARLKPTQDGIDIIDTGNVQGDIRQGDYLTVYYMGMGITLAKAGA